MPLFVEREKLEPWCLEQAQHGAQKECLANVGR